MYKERILQLICIAIITLLFLTLSSCATNHEQGSFYTNLDEY